MDNNPQPTTSTSKPPSPNFFRKGKMVKIQLLFADYGDHKFFSIKKRKLLRAQRARRCVCTPTFWWQLLMFCAGGCASVLVCGCVSVWVSAVLRAQSGPIWEGGPGHRHRGLWGNPIGCNLGHTLGASLGVPPKQCRHRRRT